MLGLVHHAREPKSESHKVQPHRDGEVTANSGSLWVRSAVLDQVQTLNHSLWLNYHYSEWIHEPLIGAPYGSGVLYARFNVTLTALPGTNDYFAFFDDAANSPRCRVRVGTTNATAGKFTFGISSSSTSSGLAFYQTQSRSLNTQYLVVCRYDLNTARSTLWINPTNVSNETDGSGLTDTTSSTVPADGISEFAFRQGTANGNLGGCLTQAHPTDCGFATYIHALQTLSLPNPHVRIPEP